MTMKPAIRWTAAGLGIAAVLWWAVQGGEYGTTDLLRQHARKDALQHATDSLRAEVDSLEAYRVALESDRTVQERVAREEFGMIRDGEILYRLDPEAPDAPEAAAATGAIAAKR